MNMASVNKSSGLIFSERSFPLDKYATTGNLRHNLKKILRPKLTLRLVAICFTGCLTGFLIFDSPYWMAGIWTALITAALFYETVRFVDQSERKLSTFLQALNQNDFSVTFSENRRSDHYDLHHAFNQLNETYKLLRSEKESQHQLLQTIVETAAVPMICFEEGTGVVYMVNDAAKKLLNVPFLQEVKALWRVEQGLPAFLFNILDGEKESLKLMLNGKPLFLSVTSQHIVFRSKNLKLTAFHDVSSELAIKEAETWQKLLRVLTHEISNSAIPLSTLSSFIYEMVEKAGPELKDLSSEDRQDLMTSLKTIEQRSKSLKEFVHNFRSVNQVPEPMLQRISVRKLLEEVYSLFHKEMEKADIRFALQEFSDLYTIEADRNLTMQVMINLVKNAIEAMTNMKANKNVVLKVEKMARFVNISVSDTGSGIAPEDIDQIFIPFYSTKKGGSGIGLSISQQIMQKQKGDITVRSVQGRGTEFILTFSS
jgi:two-component system, NtrC family, nitrogen regulation sensor histidine kinase NtrY